MKIILLQDVKKHGKKGEIIDVKDGFGKNFLIKNGLGVLADTTSMRKLNTEKKKEMELDNQKREEATEIKSKLEKLNLIFKVKTGVSDKVFGSVSAKQIAKELEKYNIDKKKINIEVPLDCLGTYEVRIDLYKDVIAKVKVTLQKESR